MASPASSFRYLRIISLLSFLSLLTSFKHSTKPIIFGWLSVPNPAIPFLDKCTEYEHAQDQKDREHQHEQTEIKADLQRRVFQFLNHLISPPLSEYNFFVIGQYMLYIATNVNPQH